MRPSRRALTFGLSAVAALASWPVTAGVTAQDRWIGKANAPVTVFEYASVTCPHCGRWNAEVWPAFKAKYVDTGKVRFVLRELPTEPAVVATGGFMLARCAPPAKYFDVIDALLAGQQAVFESGHFRARRVPAQDLPFPRPCERIEELHQEQRVQDRDREPRADHRQPHGHDRQREPRG